MVGLSGLEPPTSRLSGVRSNQLSYRPTRNSVVGTRAEHRLRVARPWLAWEGIRRELLGGDFGMDPSRRPSTSSRKRDRIAHGPENPEVRPGIRPRGAEALEDMSP